MRAMSYYVETYEMQSTTLDREVRFATRDEAEQALEILALARGSGRATVEESDEPPTTTLKAWNEGSW